MLTAYAWIMANFIKIFSKATDTKECEFCTVYSTEWSASFEVWQIGQFTFHQPVHFSRDVKEAQPAMKRAVSTLPKNVCNFKLWQVWQPHILIYRGKHNIAKEYSQKCHWACFSWRTMSCVQCCGFFCQDWFCGNAILLVGRLVVHLIFFTNVLECMVLFMYIRKEHLPNTRCSWCYLVCSCWKAPHFDRVFYRG